MSEFATQACETCDGLVYVEGLNHPDCPPELRGICESCAQLFLDACSLEVCYRCEYNLTDSRSYTVINGGHYHTCDGCSEDHAMLMHCYGFTDPYVIGFYEVSQVA